MKTKYNGEIRGQSPLAQEIRRAQKAKKANIDRDTYTRRTCAAILKAGTTEKWGAASIAMSQADVMMAAEEVWGRIDQRGPMAHEVTVISERGVENAVVEGNDLRVTSRPAQQD